jgi:hypothetical protein
MLLRVSFAELFIAFNTLFIFPPVFGERGSAPRCVKANAHRRYKLKSLRLSCEIRPVAGQHRQRQN